MNLKKDVLFITFISLLILNMALIFLALFTYFFDVKDYTLIAGIIGFIGATLGGTITLVGVNKTIIESRRKDEIDSIEGKLLICKKVKEVSQSMLNHSIDTWDDENAKNVRSTLEEISNMLKAIEEIPLFLLGKDFVEKVDVFNGSINKLRYRGVMKLQKSDVIDFELIREQMFDELQDLDTFIQEKINYFHNRYFEI